MQTTQPNRALRVACAVAALCLCPPAVQADWQAGFSDIANGTLLSDVPGWSRVSSGGTAYVTNSAGYADNGLRFSSGSTTYQRTLSPTEEVVAPNLPVSITFKWKWEQAEVRYTTYRLDFIDGDNGGGNGFRIELRGNDQNDSPTTWSQRDNAIAVSTGGASVASALLQSYGSSNGYPASSRWVYGRWYTVSITNILLGASGEGTGVTGLLTMVETDNPSVVKLNAVEIRGAGIGYGAFDRIDRVRVGIPSAQGRTVHLDEFALDSVVAPPVTTVLILR